ncbi:retrovirus-related pol polyprotein from transposon TNT 1-94 [Tanacetum coccineum]
MWLYHKVVTRIAKLAILDVTPCATYVSENRVNPTSPLPLRGSTRVNHTTSVSRPQLKSYQVKDKVVPNNSQVKFTKKEVEDHHRISSISKKTKSVTVCNNTTNSRTSNVNAVCAECGKCVFNSNHDACVSKYLNDVNARTKKPKVVPISASKPKRKTNKSVATPHKKTVASDTTIQKPKSYFKELYENTNKAWKWWIEKKCPSEYKWTQTTPSRPSLKWKPTGRIFSNVRLRWIPTGKLLNSCTSKVNSEPTHVGIVDIPHIHASKQTLGLSAETSARMVSQKMKSSTRRLIAADQASVVMAMTSVHISSGLVLHQMTSNNNRSELRIQVHSNKQSSSKLVPKVLIRSSFKTKAVPSSKGRLNLLHMDLCGPMRVASINGKKYILVIVDDYSRYTWTLFLRSKDETPEVLKDFLTMIQRNLQAQVITVRTDRGTEFLNKTLHAYFKEEGIEHQTSTPRTPEQNGVVERRNRTLVEAARTMLSASKLPLSFWAEAVATACYTQNRSIIISTHGKTAYHIINDRKPSIKHLHIFGCTCYITRDGENLDKMKEKGGGSCCLGGIFTQFEGIYLVYNKRTRLIVESIHIKFDEIKEMMVHGSQQDRTSSVQTDYKSGNSRHITIGKDDY